MTAHLALRDQGVQRAGDALPPRAAAGAVRLAVAGVGEEEAGPGQVDAAAAAAAGGDPVGLVAAAAAGWVGRGGGGAEHELAGDPELPRPAAHAGTSVLALSSLNNVKLIVYSSDIIIWSAVLSGITCSVTQTPVLLCSDSSPGRYFTRQPSPPAHTPKLFANPPHCSPN